MDFLKAYFGELVKILNEMSPFLLLGFLFAGLLHTLIPRDKIVHYLGAQNFRSVINAALLGIPLPLCSCGVVPTGLSFYKNGASKGSSVSFLISTPQTGIDSIMITYSMLGLPFALLRPVIALITGFFGGWVTNFATRSELKNNEAGNIEGISSLKPRHKVIEIFNYGFVEFLQDIAKWLVIGLLVAALISVLIPDNFFMKYQGNELINMLIAIAIAGPLYVCATGSVPIAAALMMKGLSPGAALVFLMVGPATNAATVTMVGKVLGRKTLFAYLGTVLISALFFGFVMNELMPQQWFGMSNMNHALHNHEEMVTGWMQVVSSIVLILLIINAFRLRYWPIAKKSNHNTLTLNKGMETKTVAVLGMTCNHCKMNVENNLRKLPG
ncbi:MAG TPA: permease, partial [Bacteroidales bacterium]